MLNELDPQEQEALWAYVTEEMPTSVLLQLAYGKKKDVIELPSLGRKHEPIVTTTVGDLLAFVGKRSEEQQRKPNTQQKKPKLIPLMATDKYLREMLQGCKVIDISAASAQFHASYPDQRSYEVDKVAPNVAPPFDRYVMYATCPKNSDVPVTSYAVLFEARPYDKTLPYTSLQEDRPAWTIGARVFLEQGKEILARPYRLHFNIYRNGALATDSPKKWTFFTEFLDGQDVAAEDRYHNQLFDVDWFVAPALFRDSAHALQRDSVARHRAPDAALQESATPYGRF